MRKILVFAVAVLLALAPMALASDALCDATTSENYGTATGAKIVRGALNAAFSWVELFRRPAMEDNWVNGLDDGIFYTLARLGSGAAEIVTSFVPDILAVATAPPFLLDDRSRNLPFIIDNSARLISSGSL